MPPKRTPSAKGLLTKEIGPKGHGMPVWAWIIVAGVGLYLYTRINSGQAATDQSPQSPHVGASRGRPIRVNVNVRRRYPPPRPVVVQNGTGPKPWQRRRLSPPVTLPR